jgi:hypothetical protein
MVTDKFFGHYFSSPFINASLALLFRLLLLSLTRSRSLHLPKIVLPFFGNPIMTSPLLGPQNSSFLNDAANNLPRILGLGVLLGRAGPPALVL